MHFKKWWQSKKGFTLIEAMFATVIISGALLTLVASFTQGLLLMSASQEDLIAKQKATEAMESIFSGRDTGVLTWNQLRNAHDGGVFLDGPQTMYTTCTVNPPMDGITNTADDSSCPQDNIIDPGPDGLLGNSDDRVVLLSDFTREVEITDTAPNLRQIRIIIRYQAAQLERSYVLSTLVSAFA